MYVIWIIGLLFGLLLYKSTRKPRKFPPGPPRLPIVGSLPYMVVKSKASEPNSLLTGIRQAVKKYGNIVGFYIGKQPTVILADFDLIRDIYKRDDVAARPSLKPFCDFRPGHWVVDEENEGRVPGVIFTQGRFWTEQRRFTLKVLKDFGFGKTSMEDTIMDEVEKLCDELKVEEGKPFNLQRKINVSVLNALWSLLVGEKLPLQDPRLLKIVELMDKELRSGGGGGATGNALATMFPFPEMIRWPFVYRPLGLDLENSINNLKEMTNLVEKYVKDHKSSLDQDNVRDFLDVYLLEIKKNSNDANSSFYDERGHYMLLNLLIDLLIAGMETTSSAIVWTLLLLLHHPDSKRRVLAEIDQVVGKDRTPQLDDKEKMPFTNAVLEESFRIVSFAYVAVPHSATRDIAVGEHVIPKGTTIMSSLSDVMYDPKHFPNPETFNPDRFISKTGSFKHNERVVPFGIGKRYCLGQSLAEKEFFLFMTGFLQKYDISPSPMKKLPSYFIDDNTPENILRMCPEYEMILTTRQ